MNKKLAALAIVLSTTTVAHCVNVTLNVTADRLKHYGGTDVDLATSSLVLLVSAGSDGIFNGPTPGSYFGGDDYLLGVGYDDLGSGMAGYFTTPVTGDWAAGEKVGLYWYDSITKVQYSTVTPQVGDHYGFFTDAIGHDGSLPWAIPAVSGLHDLNFFTDDAHYDYTGYFPADDGKASLTVVPEPGEYMALIGLASMGFVGLRRYFSRKG